MLGFSVRSSAALFIGPPLFEGMLLTPCTTSLPPALAAISNYLTNDDVVSLPLFVHPEISEQLQCVSLDNLLIPQDPCAPNSNLTSFQRLQSVRPDRNITFLISQDKVQQTDFSQLLLEDPTMANFTTLLFDKKRLRRLDSSDTTTTVPVEAVAGAAGGAILGVTALGIVGSRWSHRSSEAGSPESPATLENDEMREIELFHFDSRDALVETPPQVVVVPEFPIMSSLPSSSSTEERRFSSAYEEDLTSYSSADMGGTLITK